MALNSEEAEWLKQFLKDENNEDDVGNGNAVLSRRDEQEAGPSASTSTSGWARQLGDRGGQEPYIVGEGRRRDDDDELQIVGEKRAWNADADGDELQVIGGVRLPPRAPSPPRISVGSPEVRTEQKRA